MSFLDAREHGSKPGAGILSVSHQNVDRRERLRRLALATIDLENDPYFMKNHLGQYECRLCLTFHLNEGGYLAHNQVFNYSLAHSLRYSNKVCYLISFLEYVRDCIFALKSG